MLSSIKKMIPKSIKQKMKELKWKNKYKKYLKQQKNNNQKEYILFGTPLHGNIGDHAITIAEYKFLNDVGVKSVFEVPSFQRNYIINYIKNNISKDAIIMINGGGFMGSQWIHEEEMIRDVVSSFPYNKIIIFPQTIYYKNDEEGKSQFKKSFDIYNQHKNLVICTRENKSYDFAKNTYKNAKILLVPDIVIYLNTHEFEKEEKRDGILLCMRKDVEKNLSNDAEKKIEEISHNYTNKVEYTDTVISQDISISEREKIFNDKLNEFQKYRMVITDRLHGMIFALITKTPCIAIGNYNHKIKGVYEWIKHINYITFIEDISQIENNISNMYDIKVNKDEITDNKLFNALREEFINEK